MTADGVWVEMALTDNWRELVRRIKAGGMRAAVALKPGMPVEVVFPLVRYDATGAFQASYVHIVKKTKSVRISCNLPDEKHQVLLA
jgi:hypothetical protein